MSTSNLVIVAVALLATACGAKAMGPPDIIVDRTACSHCGMFVSEPVYGAAYHAGHAEPRVFDDIGCMLDALLTETASPVDVWVQDAAGGGWLDAEKATFVATQSIRTPMNGGLLAYSDVAAAERAATAHHGEVVESFAELRTRKGDAR